MPNEGVRRWLVGESHPANGRLPRAQALSWWAHHQSRWKDSKKSAALTLLRVEPVAASPSSDHATLRAIELRRGSDYCEVLLGICREPFGIHDGMGQ
jgi:hypothetical protein